MAAITANTGSNNWNTNGAWVGGVQPTAADDVTIPASAVVTILAATTVLGRSVTVQASGTLAFAATTSTLTLGDGTAGAGNVAFSNAGTITLTGVGTINFVSTAAASTQTLTTGGATMPNLTINTGSTTTIQLADACNTGSTAIVTLTAGKFDTNGQTCSWGIFNSSNSFTRTLTLGASNITVTSFGNSWVTQTTSNLTMTANTATVTLNGSGAQFFGGPSFNYNGLSLVFNGSAAAGVASGPCTLANVTRTGTATKTDSFTLATNITATGTFTATGNSATNRLLVQSNAVGAARIITAAAVSLTNTDFQDTTGAGAATWSGTSLGDALGNSGITFTTPATQTWQGTSGGNWSTAANWTSRVPLPQDSVRISSAFSASQTITMDMPRLGNDIDFTGTTGGLAVANSGNLTSYGSVTLAAGLASFGSAGGRFDGGARGSITITSAGVPWTWSAVTFALNSTALVTLQDAFTTPAGLNTLGTYNFNANNFNVTAGTFLLNGTGTITMGTGTWTITSTAATIIWNNNGGPTLVGAATVVLSTASANARIFAGGGKTYGSLTYTVANSPGSLTITGANTFNTFNIGSGRILTMPASTTNTFTTWNVNGANNGYDYFPGVTSNYASTPDAAAVSVTGDIDIRIRVAADDWTPASAGYFMSKAITGGQFSYDLQLVAATGKLTLRTSPDGVTLVSATSSLAPTITDGSVLWIRVTRRVSDGRVQFFTASGALTSPVAADFTQLGTDQTISSGAGIFDGTDQLAIGAQSGGGTPLAAKFYRAQLYNGIDGTLVFDADFTTKAFGANSFTESSTNAATVTINGTLAQAGDGRVSLVSSSVGTKATVSKSSGVVNSDYLLIQDSGATGGATWYAGGHSSSVSNNSGWIFASASNPIGFFDVFE